MAQKTRIAVTPGDGIGPEVTERAEMLEAIAGVYHRYGFEALESSAVETVEALGKFLPDVDRPNEGVFAWQDEDESWMALRYDLTAPLARVYAQHRNDLPTPYRRYAMGPVWRNEKPGPGRFRQFTQCDADTVGAPGAHADAEMIAMAAEAIRAAGAAPGEFVVRVNTRRLLDGVLSEAGVSDTGARLTVLRALDKLVGGITFYRTGPADIVKLADSESRRASWRTTFTALANAGEIFNAKMLRVRRRARPCPVERRRMTQH